MVVLSASVSCIVVPPTAHHGGRVLPFVVYACHLNASYQALIYYSKSPILTKWLPIQKHEAPIFNSLRTWGGPPASITLKFHVAYKVLARKKLRPSLFSGFLRKGGMVLYGERRQQHITLLVLRNWLCVV